MALISTLSLKNAVERKNIGGARIQTQGYWVASKNASSALRSPPTDQISIYQKFIVWLLISGLILDSIATLCSGVVYFKTAHFQAFFQAYFEAKLYFNDFFKKFGMSMNKNSNFQNVKMD